MQLKNQKPPSPRFALYALLLIAPAPTVGAWIALFVIPGPLGSALWGFAKLWLLLAPLLWICFIEHETRPFALLKQKPIGWGLGFITGLMMAGFIVAAYFLLAEGKFDLNSMRDLLNKAGLTTPTQYGLLAGYWIVLNSLMEEYVFRWFLFRQCERLIPTRLAMIVTALIFMLHHTVALAAYLPWHLNLLASFGIFAAGLTWSLLYVRYRNIWPAYVSHALGDIAVFAVGYDMLFVL